MAKVLNGISRDAPTANPNATAGDTFTFSGTPSTSGSGGTQRFDIRFEVNGGSGYAPSGPLGLGLVSSPPTPTP